MADSGLIEDCRLKIDRDQQALYDKGWASELERGKEQHGNLQANLEFLARTQLPRPGDKVLEIGCGIGTIAHKLAAKGCDVTGIDLSPVAIEYGRKKYPGLRLLVQAAEELGFPDGSFDVVLSLDVFEHIAAVEQHVREVARVLNSGGYYLFQTPNKYTDLVFETLYYRSLRWRRAHPSLHTAGQIRRRLGRNGFDVRFVKINPVNEYMLEKLRRFGFLRRLIQHIRFEKLPLALQTNLYVVAKKR